MYQMKKFLTKTILFLLILIVVNLLLLFVIPKDRNHFLCEYDRKVELLKTTPQPRIILLGGSNIPYGVNTKMLVDSLHTNVVNFGMYGGIGIRLPLEDCLQYVKKGDSVVLQMEYHNFFNGGNGGDIAFIAFMVATDWKYLGMLNAKQVWNVLRGIPKKALGNLKRLMDYPVTHSWDTPVENQTYVYTMSGFNKYGDEVSHLNYTSHSSLASDIDYKLLPIDSAFVVWLENILHRYESAGAKIIMLPPVCVETYFKNVYNPQIKSYLHQIGYDYVEAPDSMVLNDSCAFNTGYHMNRSGVIQNTQRIIKILKNLQ
jgi:hypothetical protein